jgi:hypothetical protein
MKQVVPITGLINTDQQPRTMPLGEHPHLSMVEIGSYYGKGGSLVTKRGTSALNTILSDSDTIIGSAKWLEKNRIIYFIFNADGNHRLGYLDIVSNVNVSFCDIPQANFDINYPIWHAEVIDNVLWWTDGKDEGFWDNGERLFNPPFRLNLQRVEDGEYTSIDLQTIDVIKYPSPFSPIWEYAVAGTKSNYLLNKLFQFRIQYVYEDGEESAWSPVSKMNLPLAAPYINDSKVAYQESSENAIRLQFNTGHETVKQIKVAVSVNKGQFGIFKVIDKELEGIPSNDTYVMEFLGNTSFDAIPLDTRNYDNVPQTAVCFNRLVNEVSYTNITQGYNRIEPDVEIEYPITELIGYQLTSHRLATDSSGTNAIFILRWPTASGSTILQINVGDVYLASLKLQSPERYGIFQYIITQDDYNTAYSFPTPQEGRNFIIQQIGEAYLYIINEGATSPVTGSMVGETYQIDFGASNSFTITDEARTFGSTGVQRTLKKGGLYKWYIQYYDRGNRDGTAITTNVMQGRVPFVTDQDLSTLSYEGAPYKVNAKLTINHLPPIWATHYQICVSSDNGMASFMQTTISSVQVIDDGTFKLSLQDFYQINNKGATINHQPQKGDRVRFMCVGVGDASPPTRVNYITNYFETEVLSVELGTGVGNTIAIFVQRFDLGLIDWNNKKGIQVEIYTPSIDSDVESIYEIGEEYEVRNPYMDDRGHQGNVQNQNSVLPAISILDYGDVYIRKRILGTGYTSGLRSIYAYCEDPHYSDYFVSNFNSQGRVAIEDVRAKNERINISIHGGKFVRGTNINNLSMFEFGENTQEYDPQFGFVVRTFVDGKTLKVLQPQKENSVYLNGTYSVNSDGNISSPAFSNRVFGGLRPYEGTLGCSNAGMAILIPKMGVFYFDSINGEFIYSLNNGQSRVSLNGYLQGSLEFLEISKGTRMKCFPFIESELGKVGLNLRSDNGFKTVCFNYEIMRFVAEHESVPVNGYANIGDYLVAFDSSGAIYRYNQEGRYTFHGQEFESIVDIISNEMPVQTKRFKSISLQSLKPWDIVATCPTDETYLIQETYMNADKLEKLEGAYFAQYRKNIYTGTIKSQEYYRINGNDMRSYSIVNRLSHLNNNANEGNDITLVVVEAEPSELITTA